VAILAAGVGGIAWYQTHPSGQAAAPSLPSATAQPSLNATAVPTIAPTPTPTPAPTPPPTDTPAPTAAVHVVRQTLIPWQFDSFAEADVVVEVTNTGGTWVKLEAFQSDFTIYDKDGNVATTGNFLYAYPQFLAPGATGYLAEQMVTSDAKAVDLKTLEANTYFSEIDQSEAVVLTTAKVINKAAQYSFDGPTTTGTVTNTSAQPVRSACVGAFYFDGADNLLGFSYTNLVENLAPGQTKGFSTVDGAPNIKLSSIKKTVVIASVS
jgi:hypothetical protein